MKAIALIGLVIAAILIAGCTTTPAGNAYHYNRTVDLDIKDPAPNPEFKTISQEIEMTMKNTGDTAGEYVVSVTYYGAGKDGVSRVQFDDDLEVTNTVRPGEAVVFNVGYGNKEREKVKAPITYRTDIKIYDYTGENAVTIGKKTVNGKVA